MNAVPVSPAQPVDELADLLAPFPTIGLTRGEMDVYHQFRHQAPGLVSLADEGKSGDGSLLDALVLYELDLPIRVTSFIIQINRYKAAPLNRYARIDLVIGGASHRNLGVGRVLLLCMIAYLLRVFGGQL